MSFESVCEQHFPGFMPEQRYVERSAATLAGFGFTPQNAIASVSVCRDEITRSLVDRVQETWGEAFDLCSLAGLLLCGKTAFQAAEHHSPRDGGRERYVFYGMAHIAVGPEGEIGAVNRRGQTGSSKACGALHVFHAELESGVVKTDIDDDDLEFSLMRRRLFKKLGAGERPDIVLLTHLTHDAIAEDLARMTDLTVNRDHADYAFFTGIQIHGPNKTEYVWSGSAVAWIGGQKHALAIA